MSTTKNQNATRTAQTSANTASIATAAAQLPPIVPIKYNEAIIDTIRTPLNNKLTPIESGGDADKGVLIFEGRATANKQIIIFDNGVEIARINATPTGKWVWSSDAFTSGEHQFTVQVAGAGNPVSASYDVSVATQPEQPVLVAQAIDDSAGYAQYLQSGSTTNDTTPRFTGSATPNSVVKIFDGEKEIGSVQTNAYGQWNYIAKLDGGAHSLTFVSGNVSSEPFVLNIVTPDAQTIVIDYVYDNTNPYLTKLLQPGDTSQDTTPRFDGKAGANTLIRLFDGNKEIGSTVSDNWGRWSLTPSLSAGSYNLVFKAGEGSASKPFALTIAAADAQPIEISYVYDNVNPYLTQKLKSGDSTQDTTPRFDGKAGANVIIRLYNGDQEIGSTKSNSWGDWSLTPSLSAGSYNLVFKAGEGSATQPFVLTIAAADAQPIEISYVYDNLNPYVTQKLKSGDSTQDTTPRFDGKAGANVIIRLYNGDQEIGSTKSNSWGDWSLTPSLPAGSYNLVFKAGEGSASEPFALTITTADAQPIEISNVYDDSDRYYYKPLKSGDSTQDTTPRFNGKAGANVLIRLFDGEKELGSTYSDAYGYWSLTPTLPAGSYNLVFKAGEGSVSKAFALNITSADSQPIEIYAALEDSNGYNRNLAPGATIKDTTPYFYGKAGANVVIRLYNGEQEIGSTKSDAYGSWSLTPTLTSGSYNLVFKAGEGSATTPFPVTIVSAAAEPIEVSGAFDNSAGYNQLIGSGATSIDTTPRFFGRAGANVVIRLYNGDEVLGSTVTDAWGSWTLTPELSVGNYNLVFKTAEGTASAPFVITISAPEATKPQAPEIEFILDNVGKGGYVEKNGTTDDDTPKLSGTAEPNSLVQIFDNGIKIGERRVSSTGYWEFTPVNPAYLVNGNHSFVVKSSNGTETEAWNIVVKVPVDISFVGSNSGEETGDRETADTTPLITGFGPKGVLIRLYEGDKEIGSVVTSVRDGSWIFNVTNPLSVGTHSIVAKVGNDNVSAQFDFVITAPEVPVEPENPFSITQVNDEFFDKDVVAANGSTDDTQPSIKGNAPANTLVRIFDNGTEIGSTMANGNGNWEFKPENILSLGKHAITVGESTGEAFVFEVVAAKVFAPWVLGGISEFDGIEDFAYNATIYDNTPVLNGLAVAGTVVTITIDGKVAGSVIANEYGRWSFQTTEPLAAGGHEVIATDVAGNKGGTLIFSLVEPENIGINFNVYDDNAGEALIAYGAVTKDSTPLLRGTAGQNIVLEIYDNGELVGSVRTAQDGTWSYSLKLANGDHSISVQNENQDSLLARKFTVEADAASIDAVSGRFFDFDTRQPSDGEAIQDHRVVIYGSGEPEAVVELLTTDGRSLGFTGVAASGKWYIEVDTRFDDGQYSVFAKVNGVETEPFVFHIGERPVAETKSEMFSLFDISGAELLSDAEDTLLGNNVEVETQQVNLNLTQADLSVVTTSGIATSTVAPIALQDEQYQAI
jgi:hypothetical protein